MNCSFKLEPVHGADLFKPLNIEPDLSGVFTTSFLVTGQSGILRDVTSVQRHCTPGLAVMKFKRLGCYHGVLYLDFNK